jgi:hypothetical protein
MILFSSDSKCAGRRLMNVFEAEFRNPEGPGVPPWFYEMEIPLRKHFNPPSAKY